MAGPAPRPVGIPVPSATRFIGWKLPITAAASTGPAGPRSAPTASPDDSTPEVRAGENVSCLHRDTLARYPGPVDRSPPMVGIATNVTG